ncbi:MAG: hypothetical protein JSU96_01380 [Acidobacteriota bacterium]|nr:MAG: hypothetical protein JSU96_01380 [Acidobacteriota bacterium]
MLNFEWLSSLSMSAAKGVFLGLFLLIGALVALIPERQIYDGVEERRWWHNLKLWAWGVLAVIFVTYSIF